MRINAAGGRGNRILEEPRCPTKKPSPGRYEMPPTLPDTPENIAKAVLSTPPKKLVEDAKGVAALWGSEEADMAPSILLKNPERSAPAKCSGRSRPGCHRRNSPGRQCVSRLVRGPGSEDPPGDARLGRPVPRVAPRWPLLAPFVRPLLAPFVRPLLAPFVRPLLAPFVRPLLAPFVRPLLAPFVRPLLAPFFFPIDQL